MGVEKGLVELHGKPLVEYAISVLKEVAGNILISSNSDVYDYNGFKVVHDIIPNSAPMGGIWSCLEKSETQYNVVLSCDTPFISVDFLEYLIEHSNDHEVVAPWHGGEKFEPLCAVYKKSISYVFEDFVRKGNFRIPDLFKAVDFKGLLMNENLPFYHDKLFFNINSKNELKEAERFEWK